jgi:hypothetical protein
LDTLTARIRDEAPAPSSHFPGQCPYRGLQSFEVEDEQFFFGREPQVASMLESVRTGKRFLAIVGASGSGKTSLAQAGVLAALRRGAVSDSSNWLFAVCRPGDRPFHSLALALQTAGAVERTNSLTDQLRLTDQLVRTFVENERGIQLYARLVLGDTHHQGRLVILVDQFEELFTLCDDPNSRQAFIANLAYAASSAETDVLIIIALRTDFYGECLNFPALAAALGNS